MRERGVAWRKIQKVFSAALTHARIIAGIIGEQDRRHSRVEETAISEERQTSTTLEARSRD